jgi:hypothetical protein
MVLYLICLLQIVSSCFCLVFAFIWWDSYSLNFIFRHIINYELNYITCIRSVSGLIFLHSYECPVVTALFVERTHCVTFDLFSLIIFMWVYFWILYSILWIHLCLHSWIPYCLYCITL